MTQPARVRLVTPGLVLSVAIVAVAPLVLKDYQQGLLAEILAFAVFAMAFDILYGYTGMLSFGQALYFGTGAIVAAVLVVRWGVSFPLVLGASVVVAALMALATGYFAVRVGGHNFVIITVIVSLMFYFLGLQWRDLTGGDDGLAVQVPPLQIGVFHLDFSDRNVVHYTILFLGVLAFLFCRALVNSPLGLALKAIRENDARAGLIGYNVFRYKLLAFVVAGALSGLSGVLYVLAYQFASVQLLYWTVSGDPVIWTLFGGAGTLVGPILGTTILVSLSDFLSTWFRNHQIVLGVAIIVIVLAAPEGLVGFVRARWAQRGRA